MDSFDSGLDTRSVKFLPFLAFFKTRPNWARKVRELNMRESLIEGQVAGYGGHVICEGPIFIKF